MNQFIKNTANTVQNAVQCRKRTVYIESYGCQMNLSDSEIIASIMKKANFSSTLKIAEADIILLNTCAIREKAEQTIRNRLNFLKGLKTKKPSLILAILGCMAERLKKQLLEEEKIVDIVAGPDSYRQLPILVQEMDRGKKGVNVLLSREETYADINPVRLYSNGVTAFISIMRGCDNMCSFCVVPFTRGRERSRDPHSIIQEATDLFKKGYKEVTLLGQNVDSYLWTPNRNLKGKTRIKISNETSVVNFAQLLRMVAQIHPDLRIRFSTSHPKDMTDEVLYTVREYENICKHIHLPAQSGNSEILKRMNRTYTREEYIERIKNIRKILGKKCSISSDIIAGFCGETDFQHQDTLSLMNYVQYDFSYMFCYSERPGTLAAKRLKDNIPLKLKKLRLKEIIKKQTQLSLLRNKEDIGKIVRVLIEGYSRRSEEFFKGRNSANKMIIFPKKDYKKGQYVYVKIKDCNSATLFGEIVS